MSVCSISPEAYSSILLHALKYPHRPVSGLLLSQDDGASICKTLPLFHDNLGSSVVLEGALLTAEQYCQSKKLSVCGYYQGNEVFTSTDPDVLALRIVSRLAETLITSSQQSVYLVMVNNAAILSNDANEDRPLHLFQMKTADQALKLKPVGVSVSPKCVAMFHSAIARKLNKKFTDFDDFLDDPRNDFTNTEILSGVLQDVVE